MTGEYRFRPHEKLKTSGEYRKVKDSGKRVRTPHFGVNFVTNDREYHRLGLVVQKRFWNAVKRNRIKRCLREWFRLNKHKIPLPGKDIVIVARPGAEKFSPIDMASELLVVFEKRDGRIK